MDLYPTGNPINRTERSNINENWRRIIARFSEVQRQINVLSGGQEIDVLLQRIENAITNAQNATNDADRATTDVRRALNDLSAAVSNTIAATNNANNAATTALNRVNAAIASMQTEIQNYIDGHIHLGEFNIATLYRKNNEVFYMGSTFRAKKDALGHTPPGDFTSNEFWQIVARRGEDAPTLTDAIDVWRGATPPDNKNLIWWRDPDFVVGQMVKIYRSEIPPTDTNSLWLAKREVT